MKKLVDAAPKNVRAVWWTPFKLVILSVFLAAIFGFFITRHGASLGVDLTQKKSEAQENSAVLSLLSNAKNDAYGARTIIQNMEELDKLQGNSDGLVNIVNGWNAAGAILPYPEGLTTAMNDKSVLTKLSKTSSNTLNDYKEQLDNDRNLIMDPKIETISKLFIYTRYKRDLQDLTSMLQEEIRFQNSETSEEEIAGFYKVLQEKRIELERKDMKEIDKIINNFKVASAL